MCPRDRLKFQTLEPGAVGLFGERPLEGVIKLKVSVGVNSRTGVFMRQRKFGHSREKAVAQEDMGQGAMQK